MANLLDAYPVSVTNPVAWGEMDTFHHVNNIVYFRYFENARMSYFVRMGISDQSTTVGPILGSTSCRFKAPLAYPDTVTIGCRVPEVMEDRFRMEYVVHSHKLDRIVAEGEGILVAYDYGAAKKTMIPVAWREAIQSIEGTTS